MNDIFLEDNEINDELKKIEILGTEFHRSLLLLEQKIKYVISKIKTCDTFESAKDYFQILAKIQSVLSVLLFSQELGMPNSLRLFTVDFDRVDDKEFRKFVFSKIRNQEYSLGVKLI